MEIIENEIYLKEKEHAIFLHKNSGYLYFAIKRNGKLFMMVHDIISSLNKLEFDSTIDALKQRREEYLDANLFRKWTVIDRIRLSMMRFFYKNLIGNLIERRVKT